MQEENINLINEYLNQVPSKIREEILSDRWTSQLEQLGKKYNLNQDQVSKLEYEVLYILIGMEPEENLLNNIVNEVGVSKILANELSDEINERIFKPIIKLSENNTKDETAHKTTNENMLPESVTNRYQIASNRVNHIPDNLPTAEPLPKEDEVVENRFSILDQQKDVSTQIQTPISKPIVNFFDQKLQAPTVSIKDSSEPQRPIKQYTADPYREPVE